MGSTVLQKGAQDNPVGTGPNLDAPETVAQMSR